MIWSIGTGPELSTSSSLNVKPALHLAPRPVHLVEDVVQIVGLLTPRPSNAGSSPVDFPWIPFPWSLLRRERSASSVGPPGYDVQGVEDDDVVGQDAVWRVTEVREVTRHEAIEYSDHLQKYVSNVQSRSPYHHSTIHQTLQ